MSAASTSRPTRWAGRAASSDTSMPRSRYHAVSGAASSWYRRSRSLITGSTSSERPPEAPRSRQRSTAILDRCTAELCDHVTGGHDAAERLYRAEREQLFLVSLGNQGHWFRYHWMLRDVLRREARQTARAAVSGEGCPPGRYSCGE
ncbi:hypothetical protein KZZ52_23715 [Dactylosporangium sp. AC04546]|uniref:hypothetical protein n=1 Tax=Dactylosporangium sp. AC04546 TaxID=2862460 RepID=UPI001EE0CA5A|nr:hypothetical protein [Dactylosporangium sp. AC04546]WVK88285.1 hypothetical protein KZZ52_23715 [Dactylosporangium sp. AC04546]